MPWKSTVATAIQKAQREKSEHKCRLEVNNPDLTIAQSALLPPPTTTHSNILLTLKFLGQSGGSASS